MTILEHRKIIITALNHLLEDGHKAGDLVLADLCRDMLKEMKAEPSPMEEKIDDLFEQNRWGHY